MRVLIAGARLQRGRKLRHGLGGSENLTRSGEAREARGNGYRVAKDIHALPDDGTEVTSHVDCERCAAAGAPRGDPASHVGGGSGSSAGAWKHGHHLVA